MSELERLREENAELRRRVRHLRGRDSPDLRYLFVITYGRSGSTLVNGLLNTIPGYVVRGENSDAVYHLYDYHQTLLTASRRGSRMALRERTNAFFGIGDFPEQQSLDGVRRLVLDTVLRPPPKTRVTGFKEIRWYQPRLEGYVEWLRTVFPGARFLVNTRNLADVAASKWWGEGDRASTLETLTQLEERILAVAEGLGDAAYRIHYDDYVDDPGALRGLYEWLGEEWDEETVRATFAVRHSY